MMTRLRRLARTITHRVRLAVQDLRTGSNAELEFAISFAAELLQVSNAHTHRVVGGAFGGITSDNLTTAYRLGKLHGQEQRRANGVVLQVLPGGAT